MIHSPFQLGLSGISHRLANTTLNRHSCRSCPFQPRHSDPVHASSKRSQIGDSSLPRTTVTFAQMPWRPGDAPSFRLLPSRGMTLTGKDEGGRRLYYYFRESPSSVLSAPALVSALFNAVFVGGFQAWRKWYLRNAESPSL